MNLKFNKRKLTRSLSL